MQPSKSPPSHLRSLVLAAALAAVASVEAPGQQPLGATHRVATSVPARGALNNQGGTLLARFDRDDLRGFGMTTPGTHVIRGVVVEFEDYDGSTQEAWSAELYAEDPANPGYPLLVPLASTGAQQSPAGGPGPLPFTATVLFPSPVAVPAGGDLFVGVKLQAAPNWPSDGLAIDCVLGHTSRWPTFDAPGPAQIQHGGYGLANLNGVLQYNTPRQLLIDLLTPTPGGAATAITNQANYAISNAAPGAGGFLSALHPDARALPLHTGRADDLGFVFLDQATADNSPVFFFAEFGGFGPEQSLQTVVPGSRGVFCLPLLSTETLGTSLVTGGSASIAIPIPAPVRAVLAGQGMVMQAIAWDAATLVLHASPCVRRGF